MSKSGKIDSSRKMGGKNAHSDLISLQLHSLTLSESENLEQLETLVKTYNSAARCAFKRFKEIGLRGLLKGNHGKRNFWQVDKDVGSPIQGTVMMLREWLVKNGHSLDSTLLMNAVMSGMKTYKSFEGKRARWQTSRENPVFGDMDSRSRGKLTKEEFQLTRNASITVVGKKARRGNPKFRLDPESSTLSFTASRKKIGFSFKSNRFSKKGLDVLNRVAMGMDSGELPVTVTLTRTADGKFNATLTFSSGELNRIGGVKPTARKNHMVSGIWVNDEVIHHQIVDTARNKVVHSRTWKVEDFSGEKRTRKFLDEKTAERDWKTVNSVRKGIANRTLSETSAILSKIFSTSRGYGVGTVVVETPRRKGRRDFNCSLISNCRDKVVNGSAKPCFISYSRLVKMVQNNCSRFGMELAKVDGTFIQLKSILESPSMTDAIRNACTCMVGRFVGKDNSDILLTDWRRHLSDPSMLDWVGHLLHNKRTRQARTEIRKAFKTRAVEKAVRLLDNRSRLGTIDFRA